ncbi:Stk1 family PASTA domain-containing Ser/Thr kinase [Pseudonocardia abyssalis]|uniref:non-specific serine/threonine protein kinase n=1 Tax=Pseudonocardia abyssalis TaxID=2792008 RepID=A0ABS6UMB9_9PSEU|nr:Stk1 family PASTA domain-containing Ser/Thr kinase [Pseudonocardia abyssalis]MBW0115917.1 Stk1 family PASTA domain-containing Ser/Thr kinase [Pseudonocardia abyssalis]MBW0133384.1 Stk1 family PASTA domain-containing Ser/Thr kinase [Pseudonocardia abyssalis]
MNAPPAALLDARYRLGPVIARGGMSTVYRGTDTRLDRPVAIKVMEPRLAADPAFRTRFEREARSAARIDHPAVVDVFDQGDDRHGPEPVLFLVMELVEGATLRDVLRVRGQLGVPAAVAVMDRVLSGLAEAHRLGLVHRDVKPENVLISYTGEVKVADFGLVVAAAQAGASHVGTIMGTVAYLSPEQVATGTADARSDVYAAGILLYELLTGTPPFTGETAISVAFRHVNDRVPAPSLIAGDVPPELDALVLRATDRDPAARPADAGALLAELRHVAHRLEVPRVQVPVPAPPPVTVEDTQPVVGRVPRGTQALPGGATGPPPTSTDLPGPPDHVHARRRSRRFFGIGVAVVLVIALAVGAVAWWLGTGRWTEVPSLVGVQQSAAAELLGDYDLVIGPATETFDNAAPAGAVLAADPPVGSRLLRGEVVTLTVSTGRPVVPLVDAGTDVTAAEQLVRDAGLTPTRSSGDAEFDETVPEGTVIRTEPAAGQPVEIGGPVTLVVSRGVEPPPAPQRVSVPLVVGQTANAAQALLSELGLSTVVQSTLPFQLNENPTVIGQTPAAGSVVEAGTQVVLDTL